MKKTKGNEFGCHGYSLSSGATKALQYKLEVHRKTFLRRSSDGWVSGILLFSIGSHHPSPNVKHHVMLRLEDVM